MKTFTITFKKGKGLLPISRKTVIVLEGEVEAAKSKFAAEGWEFVSMKPGSY